MALKPPEEIFGMFAFLFTIVVKNASSLADPRVKAFIGQQGVFLLPRIELSGAPSIQAEVDRNAKCMRQLYPAYQSIETSKNFLRAPL